MLSWFGNVFTAIKFAFSLNTKEVSEAIASLGRVTTLAANLDLDDAGEVKAIVLASIDAAREAADLTETQADDTIVEMLGDLTEANIDFLASCVVYLFAHPNTTAGELHGIMVSPLSDAGFGAAKAPAGNVGLWIQLAMLVWEIIRKARR